MRINKQVVSSCVLLCLLAGCGVNSYKNLYEPARKGPTHINQRVNDDIQKTRAAVNDADSQERVARDRATRSTRYVKIPRHAQWLSEPVVGSIDLINTQFSIALETLLDQRPYRIELIGLDGNTGFAENNEIAEITLPTGEKTKIPLNTPEQAGAGLTIADYENILVTLPPIAGTLKQYLDALAAQVDLSYTVEQGVVIFSNKKTQVFHVQGNTQSNSLGYVFSSEATSGGNTNSFSALNASIRATMNQIVSAPNRFSYDEVGGFVTVQGTERAIRTTKYYIDALNKALSNRVAIRLDIYDVNLSAMGARSIDGLFRNLAATGSALQGLSANFELDGSSLVNVTGGSALNFGIDRPGSALNGATGFIKFLREKGAVTNRSSREYVLLHNQVASDVRTRITPYVSGVTIENGQGSLVGSNTPSIQTDKANTGTAVQIVSTISDNRICVALTLEESRLIRTDSFSFGGGDSGTVAGTLPVTEEAQSRFPFCLDNGETIAIAGTTMSIRDHQVQNNLFIPSPFDNVDKGETRIQTLAVVSVRKMD